jgi:septal ring factor EnvC (AmiA/AmiB activator)
MQDYENPTIAEPSESPLSNIHLPAALLALAFCVFLFAQISNLGQASRSITWQAGNLDRQLTSLAEQEKRFAELIKQRETLVQQSQQVQTRYTDMLNDLLTLSDSDADARAVVEKYRIQRQQRENSGEQSSTEPAPAPTP